MTNELDHTNHENHGGNSSQGHSAEPGAGPHTGHGSTHPGGVLVSEHGYTLELDASILGIGVQSVSFRIIGPDGQPVTKYQEVHEKELHLIAVRRDMAHFQHVHPVRDDSGTWVIDLSLNPGVWRIFADFHPAGHGQPMTLGSDASVGGTYEPQQLPAADRTVQLGAYTVTLEGGLVANEATELTFTVSRNGQPVTDLQPYLGAFGHLVALRGGDLAYLHVHPEGGPGDGQTKPGPKVSFFAVAPSAGAYRLHLDFQHEGTVRTAQFTVYATAATTA
ncbi:hypothetical protein [Arthrobacter sp. CAN_C5]|uniref:hypothetical protein n=1 Tax=Arthrobacter sp. CAN_C5 TaxID=2760706 RepID=UPI001AE231F8|nr:hypothetical protein [Arthrobacter sp. CAN_C5]MBP2217072.1 hypothetical protein [Arthrobacter sp. CAN_C5]MBP2217088.1 hypothetical protein [Arthrobacter sp. CAN_C5]